MRYRGPGRSLWPIVLLAVLVVIVIVAVYVLYFMPR